MPIGSCIGILQNKKPKLIVDDNTFKLNKVVTTYSNTFVLFTDGSLYGTGSNASLQVCASGLSLANKLIVNTKTTTTGYYINSLPTYKTDIPRSNYNVNLTFTNCLVYKNIKPNISDVLDFDSSIPYNNTPFYASCLAIKKNGTLWGWGYNEKNVLGLSSTYATKYPINFLNEGDTTNWAPSTVDTYRQSTIHLLSPITDSIVDKPTQIGNGNNWKSVVTNTLEDGYKHILLNNSGEIYTLGNNIVTNNYYGYFRNNSYLSIDTTVGAGIGQFTIECWINPSSYQDGFNNICTIVSDYLLQFSSPQGWILYYNSLTKKITLQSIIGNWSITSDTALISNRWSHIAICKYSNSIVKIYINGVESGQIANAGLLSDYTEIKIGNSFVDNYQYNYTGYISNLRIVKGLAVYTTNFTPFSANLPLLNGAGYSTVLLTLQNNTFIDNSLNNNTISTFNYPQLLGPIEASKLGTKSNWKYIAYDYGIDNNNNLYRLKSTTISPIFNIYNNSVAINGPFKNDLDMYNNNLFTFQNQNNITDYYITPTRFLLSNDISLIESEIQNYYYLNYFRELHNYYAFDYISDLPFNYRLNNKEFNCLIVGTNGKLSGFGSNKQYQLRNKEITINGLSGLYFNSSNFTNFGLSRIDPIVDFNWGSGSPDPSIVGDTFSVRWVGKVIPKYTETYTFYTVSDDGVRLWVNDVLIVDNWTLHSATENSGTINLVGGVPVNIKLELYENTGVSVMQLKWSSNSQSKEIIPNTQLITNLTNLGYLSPSYNVTFQEITSFSSPITGVKMVDNSTYVTTQNGNLYTWGKIEDRIGVGKRGIPDDVIPNQYQLSAKLVAQNVKSVIPIPVSRMSYIIGYDNKLSACGNLIWGPLSSVQFSDIYNDENIIKTSKYNTGGYYISVKLLESQDIKNVYGHYYNYYALTNTGKVWLWGNNKKGYAGLSYVPLSTYQQFNMGSIFSPKDIAIVKTGVNKGNIYVLTDDYRVFCIIKSTKLLIPINFGGRAAFSISTGIANGKEYLFAIINSTNREIYALDVLDNKTLSLFGGTYNKTRGLNNAIVNNNTVYYNHEFLTVGWFNIDGSDGSYNATVNQRGKYIGWVYDREGRGYISTTNCDDPSILVGGYGYNNSLNTKIKSIASEGNFVYVFNGRKVLKIDTSTVCKNISLVFDLGFVIEGSIVVSNGTVWIADTTNHVIRKNGNVWAGKEGVLGYVDGTLQNARFRSPKGIAIYDNILYVADNDSNRIRIVSTNTINGGLVDTEYGNGLSINRTSTYTTITAISAHYPTKLAPFQMPTISDAKELFVCGYAYNTVFALGFNDTLSSWGYNGDNRLGLNSLSPIQDTPKQVNVSNVKKVVFCYETPLTYQTPVQNNNENRFEFYHENVTTFILTNDGKLYSSGSNKYGQSGINSLLTKNDLFQINIPPIQEIYAFDYGRVFALGTNNKLSAWGYNMDGLLGLGLSGANQLEPKEIEFPNPNITITKVYPHKNKIDLPISSDTVDFNGEYVLSGVNNEFVMFVSTSDNQLYAWGNNRLSQLGISTDKYGLLTTSVIKPTLVRGISSVTDLHNGTYGTITFGTTYNIPVTSYYKNEPSIIGTVNDTWLTVDKHSDFAIKSDNTLWSISSTPYQIGTDNNYENVFYGKPVQINDDINIDIELYKTLRTTHTNTINSYLENSPLPTKIINYKSKKIKSQSSDNLFPGLSVSTIHNNVDYTYPYEITKTIIY